MMTVKRAARVETNRFLRTIHPRNIQAVSKKQRCTTSSQVTSWTVESASAVVSFRVNQVSVTANKSALLSESKSINAADLFLRDLALREHNNSSLDELLKGPE